MQENQPLLKVPEAPVTKKRFKRVKKGDRQDVSKDSTGSQLSAATAETVDSFAATTSTASKARESLRNLSAKDEAAPMVEVDSGAFRKKMARVGTKFIASSETKKKEESDHTDEEEEAPNGPRHLVFDAVASEHYYRAATTKNLENIEKPESPSKMHAVWNFAMKEVTNEIHEKHLQDALTKEAYHFLDEIKSDHHKMWDKGNVLLPGHHKDCTGLPGPRIENPLACPACCMMRQSYVPELDLWMAANEGREQDALTALQAHARVDWTMPAGAPFHVVYKLRRTSCQALHAAASYHTHGESPDGGWKNSKDIVKMLLKYRAEPAAMASVSKDQHHRVLQAIHLAAGTGNAGAIQVLVEHGADPEAAATSDNKVHYLPIHDAVWFNRMHCITRLIENKAKPSGKNMDGSTALHLAAQLGYVEIVEMLLDTEGNQQHHHHLRTTIKRMTIQSVRLDYDIMAESKKLVMIKNKFFQTPFDLAIEHGQFPPRKMYLLTEHLQEDERADAFVTVASKCPIAASALLRTSRDEEDADMNEAWRKSLLHGAETHRITASVFANLIEGAPQAAMDLIDALTDTPEVQNKQHHPLPLRARIPTTKGEACSISCVYVQEADWQWSPQSQDYHGGKRWHETLAPHDPREGLEVSVKVMKLKGIADAEVLLSLSVTPDLRIFTKLLTHALLKFIWQRYKWLFICELIHEATAMAVISMWIWLRSVPSDFLRRLLWSCVASQGAVESIMFVYAGVMCYRMFGKEKFMQFMYRDVYQAIASVFTLWLAASVHERHWPDMEDNSNALLAITSLFHCFLLLFELRGFQWTGHRLLPIMKSVQPIAGMLVIMMFLLFAFVHAFWAMDREGADGVRLFEILTYLFVGEAFIESDELDSMSLRERSVTIIIAILGTFFFLACALNVFIAVLGDCYDQEQERVICTFLKERATILSVLFLRPSWTKRKRKRAERARWLIMCSLTIAICGLGIFVLFTFMLHKLDTVSWPAAFFLTFAVLFFYTFLKSELSGDWNNRYLWMCHDVDISEELFLASRGNGPVESRGRISKIKTYIFEQNKATSAQWKADISSIEEDVRSCQKDMAQVKQSVAQIKQMLEAQQGIAPSPVKPRSPRK